MNLKTVLATASAAGLALAPVAANAAPIRASAPQAGTEEMGGISPVLALLVVMGLIVALIVVAEGDDDGGSISA